MVAEGLAELEETLEARRWNFKEVASLLIILLIA